ncbi:MAG: GntR family transcriptional regulator [Acidobacteriia bacterium]|nr:GntR family transcriptional regulator [Terriglobia bacterium]
MEVAGREAASALRPIQILSAPAAAAEALRNGIIAGDLKPGERLIEQALARRLRIGQPTLREALKELEYQGFVRKGPQRGTYVTKLAREDFRSILEVRMAMETLAIEKAAPQLTAEAEKALGTLVEGMGIAARNFDLNSFHRIDVAFHRQVWALAGNPYLTEALELVAFRLFAFVVIQRGRDSRNEFLAATEQHRAILAGLASRDPGKARLAFISSTLRFWSENHAVKLNGSSLRPSFLYANGATNGAPQSEAMRAAVGQVKK